MLYNLYTYYLSQSMSCLFILLMMSPDERKFCSIFFKISLS